MRGQGAAPLELEVVGGDHPKEVRRKLQALCYACQLGGGLPPVISSLDVYENRARAQLPGTCPSGYWLCRWLPKDGGARGCFQETLLRKTNKKE